MKFTRGLALAFLLSIPAFADSIPVTFSAPIFGPNGGSVSYGSKVNADGSMTIDVTTIGYWSFGLDEYFTVPFTISSAGNYMLTATATSILWGSECDPGGCMADMTTQFNDQVGTMHLSGQTSGPAQLGTTELNASAVASFAPVFYDPGSYWINGELSGTARAGDGLLTEEVNLSLVNAPIATPEPGGREALVVVFLALIALRPRRGRYQAECSLD